MDVALDIAYAQLLDDATARVSRTSIADNLDEALVNAGRQPSQPDRKTWGRTPQAQANLAGLQNLGAKS